MIQKQKKTKKVTFSLSDLSWEPTKIITPLFCLVLDKKDRVVRAFEVTNKGGEKMNWDEIKKKGSSYYKTGSIEPIDLFKSGDILWDWCIGEIITKAYRNRGVSFFGYMMKLKDWCTPESIKEDLNEIIHYTEMLKCCVEEGVENDREQNLRIQAAASDEETSRKVRSMSSSRHRLGTKSNSRRA